MSIPFLLTSCFLAVTQLALAAGPATQVSPDIAQTAFHTSRALSENTRSAWSSFEIIGCVSVWQVWKDVSEEPLFSRALSEALPELSASNAARMETHWRSHLENVSIQEGMSVSAYARDLTDRYNFELAEAREALAGTHPQPELVFAAAGACQL